MSDLLMSGLVRRIDRGHPAEAAPRAAHDVMQSRAEAQRLRRVVANTELLRRLQLNRNNYRCHRTSAGLRPVKLEVSHLTAQGQQPEIPPEPSVLNLNAYWGIYVCAIVPSHAAYDLIASR